MNLEMNLEMILRDLRLAAVLEQYAETAKTASSAGWSYEQYLTALLTAEQERRQTNRRTRYIKEARFPLIKEVAQFDFDRIPTLDKQQILTLADCAFLDAAAPIIFTGNPGLGKTHLAIGIGLSACRRDHRVRFFTVTQLINALTTAHDAHQLDRFLDKLLRTQLIILDEFGYVPFSKTGAHLLFQAVSTLAERVSLLLTTNLPFSAWESVLGDKRLTTGLLDRLTFNSHIVPFTGDSFRFASQLAALQNRDDKTDESLPLTDENGQQNKQEMSR